MIAQLFLFTFISILNASHIPCRYDTDELRMSGVYLTKTVFNDTDVHRINYTIQNVPSHTVLFSIPRTDYKIYNFTYDITIVNELCNVFRFYSVIEYTIDVGIKHDNFNGTFINRQSDLSPCYLYIEGGALSNITVDFNFTYGYNIEIINVIPYVNQTIIKNNNDKKSNSDNLNTSINYFGLFMIGLYAIIGFY
jgi:hypothetical protein